MPRLAIYALGLLLLSGNLLLMGCSNSGDSSDQSAATTGVGSPTPIPDDQVGFSTGGEQESNQYHLKLTVGETPTDGTQQRASRLYNLTIGIGSAQSDIGGQ